MKSLLLNWISVIWKTHWWGHLLSLVFVLYALTLFQDELDSLFIVYILLNYWKSKPTKTTYRQPPWSLRNLLIKLWIISKAGTKEEETHILVVESFLLCTHELFHSVRWMQKEEVVLKLLGARLRVSEIRDVSLNLIFFLIELW